MDDWKEIHTKFMELMREEDDRAPRYHLGAHGIYNSGGRYGLWTLTNGPGDNFKARFELNAAYAGIRLGCPTYMGGTTSRDYWLHRLFGHLRATDSTHTSIGGDNGGMIQRVCEASATYSARLQRAYLEGANADSFLLDIEASTPPHPDKEIAEAGKAQQKQHEEKAAPTAETKTIGAQLNRLREQCRWTVEELAERLDIDPRSVYRHISDAAVPYKRHLASYERVFSQKLQSKVIIQKMSE